MIGCGSVDLVVTSKKGTAITYLADLKGDKPTGLEMLGEKLKHRTTDQRSNTPSAPTKCHCISPTSSTAGGKALSILRPETGASTSCHGYGSAPSSPRITRSANIRCCSSAAISTSSSSWTSWVTTNSGAASTTQRRPALKGATR